MSDREELNYEADLEIDPDNLDLEWLRQPDLFRRYSEESEFATTKVRRTHENLKTIRSELVLEVTNDPDLAGVSKATAPVIEAYYRTHKKYVKAKQNWMDAEEEAGLLRVAVFAFNQRKSALENLVKLNGQNYFASPSIPQELGEKLRENQKKEGKKDIKKKMTGRKRRRD